MFTAEDLQGFVDQEVQIPASKDAEERMEVAIELKRQLIELKDHPGYVYLAKKLQQQLVGRAAQCFQQPSGLDNVIQSVHNSGEIAGLKLALSFVDILIEHMDSAITVGKTLPDEQELDDER